MYQYVVCCFFLLISMAVAAAPPPNDSFNNRISLSGTNLFVTERINEATAEANDPHIDDWNIGWRGTKQSVWWSWTAPAKGTLTIDPSASSLRDKVLAVYRGTSLTNLISLATGVGDEVLTINVAPNETYELGVLTDTIEQGEVRLAMRFDTPPPHDDFATRAILTGKRFSFSGTLRGATDDFGHPERHDLWCEWTAPTSGRYRIRTRPEIGVFAAKGTSLTDLQWITDRVPEVNAGETLFFQIFGSLSVSGELFALELVTTHIILEPPLVISPNTTTIKLVACSRFCISYRCKKPFTELLVNFGC